jgi:hypothetical protein
MRIGAHQLMPKRWQKQTIYAAGLGAVFGVLTWHASIIQGADCRLAWIGAAIGIGAGWAFAFGQVSFRCIGAVVGSLVSLQFFRCFPCDGSNFIMPSFGAIVGALHGWGLQVMSGTNAWSLKPRTPVGQAVPDT